MITRSRMPTLLTVVLLAIAACATPVATSTPAASNQGPSAPLSIAPIATPIAIAKGDPWLVYNWPSPSSGRWIISLVRPDGSDAHPILTGLPDELRSPAWSADGSKLAFVSRGPTDPASPEGAIWVSNADGSDAHRFFDGGDACEAVFHPSWSPDGTRLAMVCYDNEKVSSLAVLDLASMSMTKLASVTYPEFMDNPSTWSPDGASIAFDIVRWGPTDVFLEGSLVATVPAAGGKVKRLTTMETFMSHPSWQPNGGALVMNSYDIANGADLDKPSNLFTIKPDGTGLRQITHSSVDGFMRIGLPRWDPDGTRISVTVMRFSHPDRGFESSHLGFADAAGGEPAVISEAFDGKYQDVRPTP